MIEPAADLPAAVYIINHAEKENFEMRPNFNFEMLGIPLGAVLTYAYDENKTCVVCKLNPPLVAHKTRVCTLTRAVKIIERTEDTVQPTWCWKYNGESLGERRMRFEKWYTQHLKVQEIPVEEYDRDEDEDE